MVWLNGLSAKNGPPVRIAALSPAFRADRGANPLWAPWTRREAPGHSGIGWLTWTESNYSFSGLRNARSSRTDLWTGGAREFRPGERRPIRGHRRRNCRRGSGLERFAGAERELRGGPGWGMG